MEEYENKRKIIELFYKIKNNTKQEILLQLLSDRILDLAPAMMVYAQHLTDYKINAQIDMDILSRAGLDLAEKEIKNISTVKSLNEKQLKTAQANTLLSVGGYAGTKFGDELKKHVDISIVEPKWYKDYWKLKTVETPHDSQ